MSWDFSQAEDVQSNAIPAGTYNLRVDQAELKKSNAGDEMLKLVYVITDGPQTGRKIFQNYMREGNEKAVQIARSNMKSLLQAGGKELSVQGAQDFVDIEISAVVKVIPPKGQYGEGNSVGVFKPKAKTQTSSATIPF